MKQGAKYSPDELTSDTLFDGRIMLYQPKKGYRFSVDSPLLTWFSCTDKVAQKCADLGCGCGVIGISLLVAEKVSHVIGVEVQPRMADLSMHNAIANSIQNRIDIIVGDLQDKHAMLPSKEFDLVVSNPPFWPSTSGRLPPDEERRIARHETLITLSGLVTKAKQLLHPKRGRFCIAFPAKRIETLFSELSDAALNVSRITFVHPNPDAPAELVLLEARTGRAGQLKISPPLYLKHRDNHDSQLCTEILSGAFCPALRQRDDMRMRHNAFK